MFNEGANFGSTFQFTSMTYKLFTTGLSMMCVNDNICHLC